MKHVKTYESNENFEIGDYVTTHYYLNNGNGLVKNFVIINKQKIQQFGPIGPNYEYKVEDENCGQLYINNVDIKRKMNKREIEKFELNHEINKYNL